MKIVSVGEAMVELCRNDAADWRLGTGGDTLNTAIYLSRLGCDVAYLTALGTDPFSIEMRAAWAAEGIDTSLVLTDPDRLPGLYAITNDDTGERSFHYWRSNSAARRLFDQPGIEHALAQAERAQVLYLSGITLSLFDSAGRLRLAKLARQVRHAGGRVVFDPNYRAKVWPNPEAARAAIALIAPYVSIAMPTYDDEFILHGDADPAATGVRWRSLGVDEVVVKNGPAGCFIFDVDGSVSVVRSIAVVAVDTTGAGDSFNAGYLAARLGSKSTQDAAEFANILAGVNVRHRGAIMPLAAMPTPFGPGDAVR